MKTLFIIEEDAYIVLDRYLESLKSHFNNTEGKEEIISDIENRITEQLTESGEKIITLATVQNIITRMGNVEDFESDEGKSTADSKDSTNPRRLYRNTDDVIVGGVASGIATFFGVDPVVVRLLFVLLTLASGFGIVLYIVLWIILPAAKSTSQKLEMKGEKITLDSLAQNVKNRVDEIKNNDQSTLRKIIAFPFLVIGKIIHFLIKVLGPALRVIFGSILVIFPSVLLAGLMIAAGGLATGNILVDDLIPLSSLLSFGESIVVFLGFLFALLIPILFILLSGVWILRKKAAVHSQVVLSLLGIWFIALFISSFGLIRITSNYQGIVESNPLYEKIMHSVPLQTDFHKLEISDGIHMELVAGTTTSLILEGRQKDIKNITAEIKDDTLSIEKNFKKQNFCIYCTGEPIRVKLTTATLDTLIVKEGSHLKSENFPRSENLDISVEYGSSVRFPVILKNLNAQVSNGSTLELRGAAEKADISVEYGSHFEGKDFEIKDALISSTYGSYVETLVTDTLKATSKYASKIFYKGGPSLETDISDGSKVTPFNNIDAKNSVQ